MSIDASEQPALIEPCASLINMSFSRKKNGQAKSTKNSTGVVLRRTTPAEPQEGRRSARNRSRPVQTNGHHASPEPSISYPTTCLCESHLSKTLFEGTFDIAVDQLFDLIFGSNEFVRAYRQGQHFFDETATEWIQNDTTQCRERTVRYKVPYDSAFFGKTTISSRESQIIAREMPGSYYTVDTDVFNEGVKFSDTFSLMIRFCLIQASSKAAHLRVTAQVYYHKSVNAFIKQLIEHNAYTASQNGLKDFNVRLHRYLTEQTSSSHVESDLPTVISAVEPVHVTNHENVNPVVPSHRTVSDKRETVPTSDYDKTIYLLLFLISCLVWIHIYLYMKLIHVDFLLDLLSQSHKR